MSRCNHNCGLVEGYCVDCETQLVPRVPNVISVAEINKNNAMSNALNKFALAQASGVTLSVTQPRERKHVPIGSGCFDYFPDALWEVAHLSWAGNEKHNPGEPLHDARSKSSDDVDCLLRHLKDRGTWDEIPTADGRILRVRHSAAVAWRALRILQKECEADGAPLAKGARE